ncbi:MAG: sensor domain-containing protein [Actinomycetota bacterium]|nr:sensor domain-containing protein [Actinomycetota bacterium]
MRLSIAALAGICLLGTGCASTISNAESATPTRTLIPRPLVERELTGLLLEPDEVAAVMGSPAMAVIESQTAMSDHSAFMAPPECLAIDGAAELQAYAGTDFRAARDQSLNNGNDFTHYAKQAVVLFPYLEKAGEFFDASVQQWPACHDYTHTQSGTQWSVTELTTTENTLTATAVQQDAAAPGWGCGRALVHQNNVIVDVNTCSASPGDSALRLAEQIADNVAQAW